MSTFTPLASVLLLAAHLVAMNVASAAPLICVWLRYRERRGNAMAGAVGRRLASWCLWSLIAGIGLGLLLLGITWAHHPSYWNAVERFPARAYWFAASELAFTAVCLAFYARLWNRWHRRPVWHAAVAVLAVTNLFYHFPPLMIVLGKLSAQPEWVHEPLVTRPVFRELLLRPEVLSKVLHFVFASVAVSGVALMLLAQHHADRSIAERGHMALVRAGAAIALAASVIQLAVGLWVLVRLPAAARNALMGHDWPATVLFFLSIVAVLAMVRALARVASGDMDSAAVYQSAILLFVVVVLMTGSLTRSRQVQGPDSRREFAHAETIRRQNESYEAAARVVLSPEYSALSSPTTVPESFCPPIILSLILDDVSLGRHSQSRLKT
jgi:hypothetical protein